jgi:hypothetical protein
MCAELCLASGLKQQHLAAKWQLGESRFCEWTPIAASRELSPETGARPRCRNYHRHEVEGCAFVAQNG